VSEGSRALQDLLAQGDFAFLLHDAGAGYTMAVRSASGRSPLFWGADKAGDYALFATSPAGRLSAFPAGCAFEVAALAGASGPLWQRMLRPPSCKRPAARLYALRLRKSHMTMWSTHMLMVQAHVTHASWALTLLGGVHCCTLSAVATRLLWQLHAAWPLRVQDKECNTGRKANRAGMSTSGSFFKRPRYRPSHSPHPRRARLRTVGATTASWTSGATRAARALCAPCRAWTARATSAVRRPHELRLSRRASRSARQESGRVRKRT
jgi:hypothetical protein